MATGLPDAIAVEVEFTYGVWTDISDRVGEVEIQRGRTSAVDSAEPGICLFDLDNHDGAYTPDNPLSTHYPDWAEGRRVRVVATYNAVDYVRFLGWIVQISPDFPGAGGMSRAKVVAADALGRLERRRLRSMLREYLLGSTPPGGDPMADLLVDYFPLTDTDGSVSAASASPGGLVGSLKLQGTASWQSAQLGETVGAPGVTLGAGSRLLGVGRPTTSSSDTVNQAGMWFTCPKGAYGVLLALRGPNGTLILSVGSGGQIGVYLVKEGTVLFNGSYGPLVNDGAPHFISFISAFYPAFINETSVYLDGAKLVEDYSTSSKFRVKSVTVGPPTEGEIGYGHLFMATSAGAGENLVARTALYDLTRPSSLTVSQDDLLGWVGQWTGITIGTTTASTEPVTPLPTEGMSALDLVQLVANNETGRLWHDYAADEVVVESTADAYPTTPTLTLDVEDDAVGSVVMSRDAAPAVASVAARNGAIEVLATDSAATTDATAGVDALVADPLRLWALASRRIATGKSQRLRPSQVAVDLISAVNDLYEDMFAITPGARVRVAGLPTTHFGVTYMDGYVEGWTERIGLDGYIVTFDLSPADAPYAAKFGTGRFGFGEGVATLNGAIDSTTTSVSIEWTGSATLSTSSGDYPLDLNVHGERMTVSSAPAGGTSPRTLTVVRGVAPTVARAHADGESVELWDAARFTI